MSYSNCYRSVSVNNNNLAITPLTFVDQLFNNATEVSIIPTPLILGKGTWLLIGNVCVAPEDEKIRSITTSVKVNGVIQSISINENVDAILGSTPVSCVFNANAGDLLNIACIVKTTDTLRWYIEIGTPTALNLIKLA